MPDHVDTRAQGARFVAFGALNTIATYAIYCGWSRSFHLRWPTQSYSRSASVWLLC